MDYLDLIPERIASLREQKGVSARDMSLSLGQSPGYINKIENKRGLPSIPGLIYICEYFGITPMEFFNVNAAAPESSKALLEEIEQLSPEETNHIMLIVKDLLKNKK